MTAAMGYGLLTAERLTIDEMKARGTGKPASEEMRALYREAFETCGPRALWSSRAVAAPTIADLLAITETLRVEGGVGGRRLAVRIIEACRAAL